MPFCNFTKGGLMKIVRLLHRLKQESTIQRKKKELNPWLWKLVAMMFLSEGVILCAPYPVKNFMDGLTNGKSSQFLIIVICAIGLIGLVELVFRSIGGYYRNGFSHRVYAMLMLSVQYQIGRLSQDWYKKEGAAGFQVVNQSVSEVKGLIDTLLYTMVPLILRIFATTIAFVFILPWFGWQAVIILGLYMLYSFWVERKLKPMRDDYRSELDNVHKSNSELYRLLPLHTSHGINQRQLDKFEVQVDEFVVNDDPRDLWWRIYHIAPEVILVGSRIVIYGFFLVQARKYTNPALILGSLALTLAWFERMASNFNQLVTFQGSVSKGVKSLETLVDFLYLQPSMVSQRNCLSVSLDLGEGIRFNSVEFKYPNSKDLVINNLDLHIRQGEMTAFIGPSGGGKTTLIQLLLGQTVPNSGEVRIGDTPTTQLHTESYLEKYVGVVLQRPSLPSGTVEEIIKHLKPDACLDEVIHAAKLAHADGFISKLPEGYKTNVVEGLTVSGGQQQRLALAMVLLKQPKLLVLDEATSNLDTESEREIQKALEDFRKSGGTVLVIAHRISTVRNADQIVVIKNGQVEEIGNHEDLLQKSTYYSSIQPRGEIK